MKTSDIIISLIQEELEKKLNDQSAGPKLWIFDFDDTLFKTSAKVYVRDKLTNLVLDSFTTSQIAENKKLYNYYLKNSCIMDFSELGDNSSLTKKFLFNSKKINSNCIKIKKLYNSKKKIGILTSRSTNPKLLQDTIKYHLNILIPLNYIIAVNNKKCYNLIKNTNKIFKNKNRKKEGLYYFYRKGYKNITFYDDDKSNLNVAMELQKDLNNKGLEFNIKCIKI